MVLSPSVRLFETRIVMEQTEAFRVLASADRQLVLHELLEHDGAADIDDISRQVAARRHRLSSGKIDDRMIERAHVRLVHAHFPHLQAQNLIDIDWDDGAVSLTDEEDVDQLLEAAEELDSWPPTDLLEQPPHSR